MSKNFFKETTSIKRKIKSFVEKDFSKIKDYRIKQILLQRQNTSSFIKGLITYYIHKGLEGQFSEEESIAFAGALEIYSTSFVILDNIVDNHQIRNNQITYLKEYGPRLNVLALQYATHFGLFKLMPYTNKFKKITEKLNIESIENAIEGAIEAMISMDIDKPKNSKILKEIISKVNGITLGSPLALAASTATNNEFKIFNMFMYGYNTGFAFGLYEELRDLFGKHGRKKAFEIESGRTPYYLAIASEKDDSINLKDYIGEKLTEEKYQMLLCSLSNMGAIEDTKNLIKNHLNTGKDYLISTLNKTNFNILDKLRIDVENSLETLI